MSCVYLCDKNTFANNTCTDRECNERTQKVFGFKSKNGSCVVFTFRRCLVFTKNVYVYERTCTRACTSNSLTANKECIASSERFNASTSVCEGKEWRARAPRTLLMMLLLISSDIVELLLLLVRAYNNNKRKTNL